MKRIILSILTLGLAMASFAIDDRVEQINAIKKNSSYLYGEATTPTQEESTTLAYERLQEEVFKWVQCDQVELCINSVKDINQFTDTMMTRRVDMYRVFVYVEKVKLMAVVDSVPPVDSVQIAEVDTAIVKKDSVQINETNDSAKMTPNEVLQQIKNAKNFFELKSIMQPLKEQGDIIDYGKYATAQHPELCYLIVYDPAGNISALLGKGDEVRQNLKTGKEDSIRNYRGCGAIWFTLRE